MTAYYNEIDPHAVAIIKQEIIDGVIAPGDVDDRSIMEVQAHEIRGYTQCHFFAGGGLWSVAARLAGWRDDRPVWSGSVPCQPHSGAASDRKRGFTDDRDLWPTWFSLIQECNPESIVGEQVDDSVAWIDRMLADMEGAGFAVGAVDLPACAVDAPLIGMRTYFVAQADGAGLGESGWPIAVAAAPKFDGSKRPSGRSCFSDYETTGELGRRRRLERGVRLLSDDVPGRVALLRVAGNAINPVVGAHVIRALMEMQK